MLRGVRRYTASLVAFARVFANARVRNVQLAAMGSTLGTWAYGVALPSTRTTQAELAPSAALRTLRARRLAAPWLGVLPTVRGRDAG
jgi:hypothetical protein